MTEIGLLSADRLALLECRYLVHIHSRVAAASLGKKGLIDGAGIPGDPHRLTDAGLAVVAKVEDEAAGAKIARPTALHPGTRFRQYLGEPALTVERIDTGPAPYVIGRSWTVFTVEPWPVAGDPERHWRVIDPGAPVMLIPEAVNDCPEPLTQMELF